MLSTYVELENKITWLTNSGKGKQTGMQYADNEDTFLSATGSLQTGRDEKEYINLNPVFKGTIFERIINEYGLFRSRLMWVDSKTCYSIHGDMSMRLHIPLVTNPDCMFIFPNESQLIHLPVGNIYAVNTLKKHSFCNFSNTRRLHFMGCMSDKGINN